MKRTFPLILVLALASTANAWPWITVDGAFDPPDETWLQPGGTVSIGLYGDGVTESCHEFYLQITGPVSYDLSEVTFDWNPNGLGALDMGEGLIFLDFAIMWCYDLLANELLMDGIEIRCEGEGDVTITFMKGAFEVLDTQIIRQVEPQWIVVDGDLAPPDEIWTEPNLTTNISIHGDGSTTSGQEFYLQITGPATYDLSEVTHDWYPNGVGALDLGDGLIYLDFAIVVTGGGRPLPSELLLDGIKIHGEAEGDVTVTMFDGSWTVLDTQIFHQSYLGANWRFDEGIGTVASDSVGDNDGVMYGPNWTAGQIAGALSFDGEDDYVDCGDDESLNLGIGSFSVSAWIRPDSLGMNEGRGIVSKWQDEANRWYLHTFEDWVGFTSKADDVWVYRTWTKGFMEAGQWYHICFVGDGTEGKLYVNGADRAFTRLYLPASLDNNAPVMIGYNNNSASPAYFDGTIDDVRLYKKALSQTEIREYYRENGGIYTFYIDANDGNDLNDGMTPQTAFATVQKGIDSTSDGDIVELVPGIYTGDGNRDIDFVGKAITVRSSSGPETCIIDCNGTQANPHRGFIFQNNEDANSLLQGLTITNGYSPRTDFDDGHVSVYGGAILCYYSSPTIDGCVIKGNTARYGGGIHAVAFPRGGALDMTIRNCVIAENVGTAHGGGINLWGDIGIGIIGRCDEYVSYIQIINCTIADNEGGGIAAQMGCEISVENSIIWRNTHNGSDEEIVLQSCFDCCPSSVAVSYSDIKNGPEGAEPEHLVDWGPGNIDADPGFVDPCNGDYRLLPASPCTDAGDNGAVGASDTDVRGSERIVDANCDGSAVVDMGAYEFAPADVGDFDGQCDVDPADFNILGAAWRSTKGQGNYNPLCDISNPKDAQIDWRDVLVLCDNWLLSFGP